MLSTDPLYILYTSGTTGFSKGVMITHNSLASNVRYAQNNMPLKPGDPVVSFLPLAHTYGCAFEFLFPFKRPYQAYGLKTEFSKLLSWQTSRFNSFPSSHTASLTALSFGLYLYNPLLGLAGLVLTLLVGIGRVILGYHYPADIIGGFLVGISGSLLIKSFFNIFTTTLGGLHG